MTQPRDMAPAVKAEGRGMWDWGLAVSQFVFGLATGLKLEA